MTGYELSYQMGITIDRVKEPFALPSKIVTEIASPAGGVNGTATTAFALAPNANWGVRAINRLLKNNSRVSWAPDNRLIVEGVPREDLEKLGVEFGVFFTALDAVPAGVKPIRAPRIALYRSHRANMDEGWTRWMLEQYGFAYTTLKNPDLRAGDLSKFDVLLFADEADTTILNGAAAGTMPADLRRRHRHGRRRERPPLRRAGRMAGGLGSRVGLRDSRARSAAAEFRQRHAIRKSSSFRDRCSASTTKPAHPLAAGMEASAVAMFADSQAFQIVAPAAEGKQRAPRDVDVFVEYPRQNFMVSGWELGGSRYLAGRVAAAHVKVGDGHAVVMGFRPHWRGQPHNTFKLLFNPLFLSTIEGAMPTTTAGHDRWPRTTSTETFLNASCFDAVAFQARVSVSVRI